MRENGTKAVVVKDLERRFGKFVAVNRVSFDVSRGEVFGFLGPNGAGKSTTIRILCGILAPSGGGGTVAGFDLRTEAERIKANIGYMSQRFSLYDDLTVAENLNFYAGIYGLAPQKQRERKDWVIEMAGLKDHRNSRTSILSGGWKQRLALGCAVLHEPPVIFLDEPTSGVDPISRRQFWNLIYELSDKGTTVFVTTHYMEEAEYCDRIGLMYRGELIACDPPGVLKTKVMREDVLEIVCERPQDAMSEVEQVEGIREVALFGRTLHAIAENGEEMTRKISETLAAKGFRVDSVEQIVPSLEDVFVSLIEERDRKEDAQSEVQR